MSAAFSERQVEVEGVRIRCLEAGQGAPLVSLHGPGELRVTPAHDLLSRRFRVIALEMPELGQSHVPTIASAATHLRADTFNLIGASGGAATALSLALQVPARVLALVLEAPAAIRPDARDAPLERRLPDLTTPVLVLFGTRDDVVPPAMGRVYKDLIPGSHLVFVYDAGHAISAERPEAFVEVVTDFLERHEAFVISRAETVIHP